MEYLKALLSTEVGSSQKYFQSPKHRIVAKHLDLHDVQSKLFPPGVNGGKNHPGSSDSEELKSISLGHHDHHMSSKK